MKRTPTRLADGRELIYFDEQDGVVRDAVDQRDLGERLTASEIRFDPLREEWVALASHRQARTHLPPTDECPLCPTRPDHPTEIPASDYDVVVFENRFPAFAPDVPEVPDVPGGHELVARRAGIGRCEVICFTSDHDASSSSLTPARARLVLDTWADRTAELSRLPGIEQVFCFENRGEEIGVTLHHPHGQIYAYPFVTPRTRQMLAAARRHQERTFGNLFADVLAAERRADVRVVRRTEHWTAFVPAAARWPLEVDLYPNRQVADLVGLTDEERDDFCELYLDLLRRLDRLYDRPLPYIAAWHQAPVRSDRDLAYLHLELFSIRRAANKLKFVAGSESAMGVFISDVAPESVAARLRDLGPEA
ncbi:MAG: galactose-1-phosphate uridylyltransferase [Candidatus Limnocylindria bacterium]